MMKIKSFARGSRMEPTIYTKLKVNNEIELCEVSDLECKEKIEKVLLKNRISYFVRWNKKRFWSGRKETCIFCINSNSRDAAEQAIHTLGKEVASKVSFLMVHIDNDLF